MPRRRRRVKFLDFNVLSTALGHLGTKKKKTKKKKKKTTSTITTKNNKHKCSRRWKRAMKRRVRTGDREKAREGLTWLFLPP